MPLAPRDARRQRGVLAGGLVLLSLLHPAWAGDGPRDDQGKKRLLQLSLDQLAELEVTTVSRKPESLREAPAAVHVVTGDDVRRTGTTSLADSLRLAPGVHVVRIDSNKWGFGVRGFTSRLSRSMLALIDGRSVYTPLFAGVYWEV